MTHEPTADDWAEAVRRVRAYYPEDIFPWPSTTPDGAAARMARLTCDNVVREATRIVGERKLTEQRYVEQDVERYVEADVEGDDS